VSTQSWDEKKNRINKIEEKEKVSTQNNKNKKKKNFPGLSGSGDPQKKDLYKQKTYVYMETSWEKKITKTKD